VSDLSRAPPPLGADGGAGRRNGGSRWSGSELGRSLLNRPILSARGPSLTLDPPCPLADANYNFCIKKAVTGFPGSEVVRTVSWTAVGNGRWVLKVTGMSHSQASILANGEQQPASATIGG
jgi:hypothetical protein